MVIDHADCLHKGINDNRSNEFKSAFFEILS